MNGLSAEAEYIDAGTGLVYSCISDISMVAARTGTQGVDNEGLTQMQQI